MLQEGLQLSTRNAQLFFQTMVYLFFALLDPDLESGTVHRPIEPGPNPDPASKHCYVQHFEQSTGVR